MNWLYRHVVRPVLFTQPAESIHNRTMGALGWASRHPSVCSALHSLFGAPRLPVDLFGLNFPNPVGLAAGMDKHAEALPAWHSLGFGFSELGAVTWRAQPGNPPPRVFRAISDQAVINRMGFNNPGAEALALRLADWRASGRWPNHPVGINLGKSKITPLLKAAQDYADSFRLLRPYLDFFVVNVSSPNTPNLRQLQDKAALDEILAALQEVQKESARTPGSTPNSEPPTPAKPILVKLAGPRQIAGIVATNTTLTRPQRDHPALQRVYAEAGGLSGAPLRLRSTEVVRHLFRQTRGAVPIIGVGGIFNAVDAWEKITAGAALVQVYTGMVFEGPGIARAIVSGLAESLRRAGLKELRQAVGIGVA